MKRLAILLLIARAAFPIAVTYGIPPAQSVTVSTSTGSADIVISAQSTGTQQFETGQVLAIGGVSGYKIVSAIAQVGNPATTSTTLTLKNADQTAYSAAGTASGLSVTIIADGFDYTSIRVWSQADRGVCMAVWFDVTTHASGPSYAYRSGETGGGTVPGAPGNCYGTVNAATIVGLEANTVYYFRGNFKTAFGTNNTGACYDDSCGAVEFSLKTPPNPNNADGSPPSPALPAEVASWVSTPPDMSGYTTTTIPVFPNGAATGTITNGSTTLVMSSIPSGMAAGQWIWIEGVKCPGHGLGAAPWCKIAGGGISGLNVTLEQPANASVSAAPVYWSLYNLHTLANAYGKVFEVTQGATLDWWGTDGFTFGNEPLKLPALSADNNSSCAAYPSACSIDDPAHRWIVVRTKSTPGTLPPTGVRTGPDFSGTLAKIVTHNNTYAMEAEDAAHHYRFENLEFTSTPTAVLAADPVQAYGAFTLPQGPGRDMPRYMAFDRLYIHTPDLYSRGRIMFNWNGIQMALMNSWMQADFWRPWAWHFGPDLTTSGSISFPGNNTIGFPGAQFYKNKTSGIVTQGAATITSTGTASCAVTIYGLMDLAVPGGLSLQYTSGCSVTLACPSCGGSITATATPAIPSTAHVAFVASISNASTNITCSNYCDGGPDSAVATEGAEGIHATSGDHWLFLNNHFESYGNNWFIDVPDNTVSIAPSPSDVVIRRNHHYYSQDHLYSAPESNGFFYNIRHSGFECKRCVRFLAEGNDFDGGWARVNHGEAVSLSVTAGEVDWPVATGISDITIRYNRFRRQSEAIAGGGHQSAGRLWGKDSRRVEVSNNIFQDLNGYIQTDRQASVLWGRQLPLVGHGNRIIHNTIYDVKSNFPVLFQGGPDRNPDLWYTDNIFHFNWAGYSKFFFQPNDNGTLLIIPNPISTGGGLSDPTLETAANNNWVRLAGSATAAYKIANNVAICGSQLYTPEVDWDSTDCSTQKDLFGATIKTLNYFPAGNTKAARNSVVAWANATNRDLRLAPSSIYRSGGSTPALDGRDMGADTQEVDRQIGRIQVGPAVSVTGSGFTVKAFVPDIGASCSVAYGTTSSPGSWSKETATATSRELSIAVTGLSTGLYYWQLWCAGTDRTATQMVRIP